MTRRPRAVAAVCSSLVAALVLSACGPHRDVGATPPDAVRVVTTTGILADLARNVGADRVEVTAIVPDGADPHAYEPTLRDIRDVVYADVAFTNYLLLEEQSIIRALDANLRNGVPNVSLAESAVKYAAEIIPLVEDVSLDTVWLGLRVQGDGAQFGADRNSDVVLSATGVDGPGALHAYLTGSFGDITRYIDSSDGFDAAGGHRDDSVRLPPSAHTHLSWAFTAPGVYRLHLDARLQTAPTQKPIPIAAGEVVFAVGVDPYDVAGREGAAVLSGGHADVTVDLDAGAFTVLMDHEHGAGDVHREFLDLVDVVVEVPNTALHEIPGDPSFRFLGHAGEPVFQLPQAVLGKHVHGEIDPHLWQNVRNAMSYVEIMRDTLIEVDPRAAADYRANAAAYLRELEALDAEVRDTIARIPPSRRTLVTTHDAFGYLAAAYDMRIAGFVTPNPATEPSIAERKRLTQTIRNLEVPAVFLEPGLASRSATLVEVAGEQGIEVCPIYGDALDDRAPTYADMMRFNARSLLSCLGSATSRSP